VASFEVFAAIIIVIGKQAGWGLQFGNPLFLVLLTTLLTLVALNLFGVFEVTFRARSSTACSPQFWPRHAPRPL
jgi:suppressor for copper-sensitivity B